MNDEQQSEFHERGYVVLRGLFDESELRPWITRLSELVRGEAAASDGMLIMRDVMVAKGAVSPEEPAGAVAKVQDFDSDPVLRTYTEHPRVLEFVESVCGADIVSIHCMLINKPPGVDGRHPFHQDLLYFPFGPADRIVGAWTALEPVDRANGCLAVVPGSHRGGALRHVNPDWEYLNLGYFAAERVGAHPDRVHLEMAPGDTVFFHPLLLHGSGRNRSEGYRRAISSHFADAGCRYPEGVDTSGNRRYRLLRGQVQPGGILAP